MRKLRRMRNLRRMRKAYVPIFNDTTISPDVERRTLKIQYLKKLCVKCQYLKGTQKKPYITRALIHRAADYHSSRTMYHVSEGHLIYHIGSSIKGTILTIIFAY